MLVSKLIFNFYIFIYINFFIGTEMKYQLYDPTIQKIEVLRLEKRLDNELLYLRDAPNEYSTFDENMETEYLPEGAPVPVNTTMVN